MFEHNKKAKHKSKNKICVELVQKVVKKEINLKIKEI